MCHQRMGENFSVFLRGALQSLALAPLATKHILTMFLVAFCLSWANLCQGIHV